MSLSGRPVSRVDANIVKRREVDVGRDAGNKGYNPSQRSFRMIFSTQVENTVCVFLCTRITTLQSNFISFSHRLFYLYHNFSAQNIF